MSINEVHPNPESGSEWIELFIADFSTRQHLDLLGWSISDATKIIYQFTESFTPIQELIVIEVSGLNNDQDSVILKDAAGQTIDSFSYTSTQKGLSWAKNAEQVFTLSQASKGLVNPAPVPTQTPTPITSLSPSTQTTTPRLTSISIPTPSPTQPLTKALTPSQQSSEQNRQAATPPKWTENYPLQHIQLQASTKHAATFSSRLVLMGDRRQQGKLQNVIMGSLLLLISSSVLLYVKVKSTKKHA